MQIETWYDLAVRELSERTDPARERLEEAEETAAAVPDEPDGDEPAEDAAPPDASRS